MMRQSKNGDITLYQSGSVRVYYFEGNFYQPLDLRKGVQQKVDKLIRNFRYKNSALIEKDRAKPTYKTLVALCDDQLGTCND